MGEGRTAFSDDPGPQSPEPLFCVEVKITVNEFHVGRAECQTSVTTHVQSSDKGNAIEAAFSAARDRLRLTMDEPAIVGGPA